MDINRFIELLENYLQNRVDEDEQNELFLMIASDKYDAEISKRIDASFDEDVLNEMDTSKAKEILEYITRPGAVVESLQEDAPHHRISPRVVRMWKWAVAASIILLIGITTFIAISKRSEKSPQQVATTHDVPAPTGTRAVITLADGSKVYLDSLGNGVIAQENNVAVVKKEDGSIIYSHKGTKTQNEIAYNTLFNPRGSKVISLTLSDGTKVWLNSESSLKYPTAFAANTREVEITGEAYFEVKHNSEQPFKVHLPNGSVVEDIGTTFNVNAYSDEDAIKTTLIEGSVIVRGETSDVKLKPGEQAVLSSNFQLQTTNPDLDAVMAWKNGLFSFENAGIESVMKQIARWYDVEVVYESSPTKIFRGSIPREMSAAKVFKALEETGGVHFRIEGKKIIVMK